MFRLTLPSLRFAVFVFLVLSFLVFTPHSIAQESDVVVPQYNPVAAEYAKMLSVSYDDAVERLDMQNDASSLTELFVGREKSFAGSWIQHVPDFKLIVAVSDGEALGRSSIYLAETDREFEVEVVLVEKSLEVLRKELAAISEIVYKDSILLNLVYGFGINAPQNKVTLYSPDVMTLTRYVEKGVFGSLGVEIGDLDLVVQEYRAEPAQYKYPYLTGPQPISSPTNSKCTLGYTVRRTSDNRTFVSTAGHCQDTMSVEFVAGNGNVSIGPIVTQRDPMTDSPELLAME